MEEAEGEICEEFVIKIMIQLFLIELINKTSLDISLFQRISPSIPNVYTANSFAKVFFFSSS